MHLPADNGTRTSTPPGITVHLHLSNSWRALPLYEGHLQAARRGGEAIKSPKAHAKLAVNMIAQQNQVVITHLGEPCVFDIDRCELSITEDGLDLDVFTNPNRNCPLGHLSAPTIHIESATVNAKTIEELTKEELNVPVGWDTDDDPKADNIFRIYISQHEALNNNRVEIARNQKRQIEIKWQADAQDFLDFRNPDCTVEAYCVIEGGSSKDG